MTVDVVGNSNNYQLGMKAARKKYNSRRSYSGRPPGGVANVLKGTNIECIVENLHLENAKLGNTFRQPPPPEDHHRYPPHIPHI